jgi:hypothetical protein
MKTKLIFLGLLFCSMLNCMQRGTSFQPMPQPMPMAPEFNQEDCQYYYDELNDLKDKLKKFKEKVDLLKELKVKADEFSQGVEKLLNEFEESFGQFNQNFNW